MTRFEFEGRTYEFREEAGSGTEADEQRLTQSVANCMHDIRREGKYPAFTARNADACEAIVACKLVSAATASDLRLYLEQQRRVRDRYADAMQTVWDLLTEEREASECPPEIRQTVGLLLRRVAAVRSEPQRARHRLYLDRAVASMAFSPECRAEEPGIFAERVARIAQKLDGDA